MGEKGVQLALSLACAALFLLWLAVLWINGQMKTLKQRLQAVETELRPGDGQIWHWSYRPGVRRCGNDLPNTASTSVKANVTCSDCRRLMRFDEGLS